MGVYENIQKGKYRNNLEWEPYKFSPCHIREPNPYYEEEARLMELFWQDLFEELEIQDHPKRDALAALAWDYGHSSGLNEVFLCASEFVRLLV